MTEHGFSLTRIFPLKVRLVDNINDLNETEYYDNCMYYKKNAFADGMKDSPMDNL